MKLLTIKQVSEKIAWKRTKIYGMIKAGKFPPPRKLGHSSRWLEHEIDDWISKQIQQT